jgi:hypothetical protein
MGNILTNITRDNSRFTIFENDQVLTADQLNDLFNYLDVQTRLTRTRAIGIGIICGLEIGMLENGHLVVSKGTAITTDGDLLHIDTDQEFDMYEVFEDVNAKYPYLRMDNGQVVTMYELRNSSSSNASSPLLSGFEQATNTVIKDHVGILYLEDYKNDPDVCTGTDCDNKGAESVKDLKVLLIHKNNMKALLASIPVVNRNYFSLEDIAVPRVSIRTTVDTYPELNAAFNDSLAVKEDIKNKLLKAYQICRLMLDDEFGGVDPTTAWNSLLDEHFKIGSTIYGQYVYDFARDLSYAYNELRETLFGDNMMCCPDVELFPKHVLMGLVKSASVSHTIDSPPASDSLFLTNTSGAASSLRLSSILRFDIGSLIRRFHPIHIDTEYRHHFYESPVLNNKEENVRQTRFCFVRINAMIRNFKVPTSEELQILAQGLQITPSHFEDRPLGERSIPFYYKFDSNLPVNLYWNFKANIRKMETQLFSYFSNRYSNNPATVTPLRYNLLPFNFFRIEGHIGFKFKDVEAQLNKIILENNLPINIMSVQIENNKATIPRKDWYFPELHLYEHFVRNAFMDQLDQVEVVHSSLKESLDEKIRTSTNPEDIATYQLKKNNIEDSTNSYSIARKAVIAHPLITQSGSNEAVNFKNDVENLINKTNEIKRQTKEFAFSNTAIPHDFVINTDITRKADLFADFTNQKVDKKVEEYILSNFIQKNPGLEHAGGVLRGGTFVLIYRSEDEVVVSDFMLPYASIDKDIVKDPPRPTIPTIPPRVVKKFDPKVIEIEPTYLKAFNSRIGLFDSKVALFDSKISLFDSKIAGMDSKLGGIDSRVGGLDFKVATIPVQSGTSGTTIDFNAKFAELNGKFTTYDAKIDDVNTKINGIDAKVANQGVQIGQFNSQLNATNVKLAEFDTKTTAFETKLNSQDSKFTEMDGKISTIDARVTTVNTRVGTLDTRIGTIDTKIGGLDTRVGGLDTKVSTLDSNVVGLNTKVGTLDTNVSGLNTRISGTGGNILRGGIIT